MSNFSLRLPDTVMNEAKTFAKENNVSLNQFFLAAISEKMGELKTQKFFKDRARGADIEAALKLLEKVSDEEPKENDRLK